MWWWLVACVVFAVLTVIGGKWANSQPGDDFGVAIVPLAALFASVVCGLIFALLFIYHWYMGV